MKNITAFLLLALWGIACLQSDENFLLSYDIDDIFSDAGLTRLDISLSENTEIGFGARLGAKVRYVHYAQHGLLAIQVGLTNFGSNVLMIEDKPTFEAYLVNEREEVETIDFYTGGYDYTHTRFKVIVPRVGYSFGHLLDNQSNTVYMRAFVSADILDTRASCKK